MQSDHKTPQHIPSPGRVHRQHLWNKNAKERREAVGEAVAQVFDVIAGDVESHAKLESASHQRSLPDINHYMIVNEVWHYASVDWGYKCKPVDELVEQQLTSASHMHRFQFVVQHSQANQKFEQ
jgi:hypothetical protein